MVRERQPLVICRQTIFTMKNNYLAATYHRATPAEKQLVAAH
jgi:hypothetical protein